MIILLKNQKDVIAYSLLLLLLLYGGDIEFKDNNVYVLYISLSIYLPLY
jgi:hypothetical protein